MNMISEGVAHLQILTDADANINTYTIWSDLVKSFESSWIPDGHDLTVWNVYTPSIG